MNFRISSHAEKDVIMYNYKVMLKHFKFCLREFFVQPNFKIVEVIFVLDRISRFALGWIRRCL